MDTPHIAIEIHDTGGPKPLPPCRYDFPLMLNAPSEGPAGAGADFEPQTLLAALRQGAFPWPHDREQYLWFSPNPRAVIELGDLHVSRRLARTIRQARFRVTMNAAFEAVLHGCADREEGTWITPDYMRGYLALHSNGYAHSIEVWTLEGDLAGGIYGVALGGVFGAESMFHTVTDASKIALAALVQRAREVGASLIDVQVINDHTASLGATNIPRSTYLHRLTTLRDLPIPWSSI